ncbi:hypothetical protein D3C71_589390 [compost metagenome]
MARRLLAVAGGDGDGALGGHHVAARKETRHIRHQVARHLHHSLLVDSHAGNALQHREVYLLTERQDQGVRFEGFKLAGGHRLALGIQRHHLHFDAGVVELANAAQPVDLDPLLLGLVGFKGVGGHVVPVATVDDHRLLDPEAAGCTGRIHSGVAAAVDRHSPPQFGGRQALLFGQTGLFEETHRIEDLARFPGRNIDPLGQMGADSHKNGVKAPLVALAQHILHLVVEGQRHPGRHDAGHLPIQHIAG